MRQSFLDKGIANKEHLRKDMLGCLRMIVWNIRNPSKYRAIEQCRWLEELDTDLLVLTELKSSQALEYYRDRLASVGYKLFYKLGADSDYLTAIGTRLEASELQLSIDFLPQRAIGIRLKKKEGCGLKAIGLYVPSRGSVERRNIDKRRFQKNIINMLDDLSKRGEVSNLIIGGDLNVVEPNHVPRYSFFGDWEYELYGKFIKIGMIDAFKHLNSFQDHSWFGKKGEGYRFDHIFVSGDLRNNLTKCYYVGEVRERNLSDHSAMILELRV
jgi:exonuclease III